MKKQTIDPDFWHNKKVFITGHSGFKGSWLTFWLLKMGADICGYALKPPTQPALFDVLKLENEIYNVHADVRDGAMLMRVVKEIEPDIILHLAAQPLVRESYLDPVGTYETNVMGTVNVLESARQLSRHCAIVNVTTDKCYENYEKSEGYKEDEPMGGYDPYSSSKGCSELVSSAYRRSFFGKESNIDLATARAGNVIGGGDWAVDRIIPDAFRALESGQPLVLRNPESTRPWQHVMEPLSGYLLLAQNLYQNPHHFDEGWNFGPRMQDAKTVRWVVERLKKQFPQMQLNVTTAVQPHEANLLQLDIHKAEERLGWTPTYDTETAIDKTGEWMQAYLNHDGMRSVTERQINEFVSRQNSAADSK